MPEATDALPIAGRRLARVQSVDILRGAAMVIMAIDHTRDFLHYGAQHFAPEDLTLTNPVLFFTRWMTHFCAPVFMFLAGTGAWLSIRGGKSPAVVSRFLWTRGLWLIVVEMTLVVTAATFNFSYAYIVWQVIWALGWSMIALSALIYLPWRVLLAGSIVMIATHNAFDKLRPEQFGALGWLWSILHVGFTAIPLSEHHVILVIYPLIPWIGVMAAGFCFGRIYDLDPARRRPVLLWIGAAVTAAFVAIRVVNLYGDPNPWTAQSSAGMTVLSFLNASKYPPSLDYLLMTLGPAMVVLGALDGIAVSRRNPLLVFGRVPLFYYIVHWYVIHLTALALAAIRYGRVDFMFGLPPSMLPFSVGYPADYGYRLWVVYAVWAGIVAMLYPLCAWFAGVKARSRSTWIGYL